MANARGANLFDGGAPFYATLRVRRWQVSSRVGVYEDAFYRELLARLGITDPRFADQWDRRQWPALRETLAAMFRTRARDDWAAHFAGTDACVTPVLDLDEAPRHPHNRARGTFDHPDVAPLPAAAPRFSRTPAAAASARCTAGRLDRPHAP